MRVLHVAASLATEWGGPSRVIVPLVEMLVKKDIRCDIYAPGFPTGSEVLHARGFDVHLFPVGYLSRWWKGHSPLMACQLKKEVPKFDLVHIHELWHFPSFAAYRAAYLANKPYVVTIHGALQPWALNYKAVRKRLYWMIFQHRMLEKATVLHVFTKAEAEQVCSQGLYNAVAIIPNGISMDGFIHLPRRDIFEAQYPDLKGKRVILFLGRLHPIKGLDLLCRAFSRIAQEPKMEDVRLVIAGPDECGYRPRMEMILRSAGVLDKSIFTGILRGGEKLAALARADVFVLPSYSEGFSMAVLEALACHLPVIITRPCNFPEVAEAGAGEVIDPDVDQLTAAFTRLLSIPDLRHKMGDNGRQLILSRYTWDKIADQMITLYESAVSTVRAKG